MEPWRQHYPVHVMIRVFAVSRSGFYNWISWIQSACAPQDERLKVAIQAAHTRSCATYGVLRLQPELAAEGFTTGRDCIARWRRELGRRCRQPHHIQSG
jgi:putative transposase